MPGHWPYSENAIFLLLFLSTLGHWIRQTKSLVMMTRKGSTKIVNFMIPGAGVLISVVTIVADYRKIVAEGSNQRQSIVSFHNRFVAENSGIF